MAERVKVLIAGDNENACWLLRLALQEGADVEIVGHVTTGRELGLLTVELSPQVVVLDLDSPGQGIEAAIKVAKLQGRSTCFVGLGNEVDASETLVSELDAVLPKDTTLENLWSTIHQIARRGPVIAESPPPRAVLQSYSVEQLLSQHMWTLERSHKELEERLNLMQFWLHSREDADHDAGRIEHSQPVGQLTNAEAGDGDSGGSLYALAVDAFFNAQHRVSLGGLQGPLHPHSWRVSVKLAQHTLGEEYVLLGFREAKQLLLGEISWLDGKILNTLPQFADIPPTTENIAALLFKNLKMALKDKAIQLDSVTVWETPTNSVTYREDRG